MFPDRLWMWIRRRDALVAQEGFLGFYEAKSPALTRLEFGSPCWFLGIGAPGTIRHESSTVSRQVSGAPSRWRSLFTQLGRWPVEAFTTRIEKGGFSVWPSQRLVFSQLPRGPAGRSCSLKKGRRCRHRNFSIRARRGARRLSGGTGAGPVGHIPSRTKEVGARRPEPLF